MITRIYRFVNTVSMFFWHSLKKRESELRDYFFAPWHIPADGQLAQPQPQDDFPFFLFEIRLRTANPTITSRIKLTMIVPIFEIKKFTIINYLHTINY
jgi:hypothetical protein